MLLVSRRRDVRDGPDHVESGAGRAGRSQQAGDSARRQCRTVPLGRPAMFDIADSGGTVDKRSDSAVVADENIASVQLKGVVRQRSSPAEVVENFLQTVVGAGNVVVALDGPSACSRLGPARRSRTRRRRTRSAPGVDGRASSTAAPRFTGGADVVRRLVRGAGARRHDDGGRCSATWRA